MHSEGEKVFKKLTGAYYHEFQAIEEANAELSAEDIKVIRRANTIKRLYKEKLDVLKKEKLISKKTYKIYMNLV